MGLSVIDVHHHHHLHLSGHAIRNDGGSSAFRGVVGVSDLSKDSLQEVRVFVDHCAFCHWCLCPCFFSCARLGFILQPSSAEGSEFRDYRMGDEVLDARSGTRVRREQMDKNVRQLVG